MAKVDTKKWGRKVWPAKGAKQAYPKYVKVEKAQKRSAAAVRQGAVELALDIVTDNRFHYGKKPGSQHNGCPWCGQASNKAHSIKMRKYSFCCNPFVHSMYAHGGGDKKMLKLCKKHSSYGFKRNEGFAKSSLFKRLHCGLGGLVPGDVICYHNHCKMYVGKFNGKHYIVHSSGGDDNKIGSSWWNRSIRTQTISSLSGANGYYRYIGSGGAARHRRSDCVGQYSTTGGGGGSWSDDETGGTTGGHVSDDGSGIVLEKEIAQLWSSDNFEFVELQQEESPTVRQFAQSIQDALNLKFDSLLETGAVPDSQLVVGNNVVDPSGKFEKNKAQRLKGIATTDLLSYPTYVEAPTIVLDFNGIKIGGHGNRGDEYPNYIESMQVKKINGRINQYTFNLGYQIRPGEDPNFIDKLIARTGYRNPLKVLYGDSNYNMGYYRDEEMIITDAKHSEDPASAKITYTITALSSLTAASKLTQTYSSVYTKPSNELYNLLYNSGEQSQAILSLFPGMKDKNLVASSGLIPNNDSIVQIGGLANSNPISRISQLVSCMSNANATSSYYLSYCNDNRMNGDYFKVTEVKKVKDSGTLTNATVYTVDVGYPTENNITNFQVCNNDYWSLAYKFAGDLPTYEYDMDNDGNVIGRKINLLTKNKKFGQSNLMDQNWWKQVTEFPISAKLTLKGLLSPAMLMSYIEVNVMFYGQRDMASGLYVVTEENDTISGDGYRTELTLLRVSED